MKKLAQGLFAFAIVLGTAAAIVPNTAQAQAAPQGACTSIVIVNNGSNSNNNGVCRVNVSTVATCENNVYVLDANSQRAVTGAASQVGTGASGAATSGNATNSNGTAVQLGASCGSTATPTTPTTPSTPTTPTTSTTPSTPVAQTTPNGVGTTTPSSAKALPNTAGENIAVAALAVAVVAAVAYGASRLVLAARK